MRKYSKCMACLFFMEVLLSCTILLLNSTLFLFSISYTSIIRNIFLYIRYIHSILYNFRFFLEMSQAISILNNCPNFTSTHSAQKSSSCSGFYSESKSCFFFCYPVPSEHFFHFLFTAQSAQFSSIFPVHTEVRKLHR